MKIEDREIIKCPRCKRPYPKGKDLCSCCILETEEEEIIDEEKYKEVENDN